jgi:L-ascorbate metabolism protein UlaG (beta-lactamase superfamily)
VGVRSDAAVRVDALVKITWLGHSSVLLEVDGVRLLADPLLRDRVGVLRRTEPVPESDALGPTGVEAVLLSHLHDDHCDLRSLRRLDAPVVVAAPGAGRWLTARGVRRVVELRPGTSMAVGPILVHAVRAEHDGRRRPWGPPVCAVGHVVTGTASAWLAGDTAPHEGMPSVSEIAGLPGPDLAVLPVWGWGPRLGPGHLNPAQAAEAAFLVRARYAVPVHWGTLYPVGLRRVMRRRLVDPGPEFAAAVTALGERRDRDLGALPRVSVLPVGGSLEVVGRR